MEGLRSFIAVLSDPVLFFKGLKNKRQSKGFIVNLVYLFPLVIVSGVVGLLIATSADGASGRRLFSTLSILFTLLAFLSVIFKTALVHLSASLWGKTGDVRFTFMGNVFSFVPFLLLLPVAILLRGINSEPLIFFFYLGFLFVGYRIEVFAIAANYDISPKKALLVFLTPFLMQVIFGLIVILGVMSMITGASAVILGMF